jgi:hypothetical protein
MQQEFDDYGIVKCALLRPRMMFGDAESLRDVLALIHGIALARFPPHGSGFLAGFSQFVASRFGEPSRNHYSILMEQYGSMPGLDGCKAVLSLLEEWKATEAMGN